MEALTTKTFPRALAGVLLKERNHFKLLPDAPVIAGQTIIVNRVGLPFIYMGDDLRREIPISIIAADFGGNLVYLDIDSKVAIELLMERK